MRRNSFGHSSGQQVVAIDSATVQRAQRMVTGCEACTDDAELPFQNILDRLTGCDPTTTVYFLEPPTRCLWCGARLTKKTLVQWDKGLS
jgi:hypothetical protein